MAVAQLSQLAGLPESGRTRSDRKIAGQAVGVAFNSSGRIGSQVTRIATKDPKWSSGWPTPTATLSTWATR